MRILTDKQLKELKAECYNQGLIDANDKYYNQGLIDANDKYYNQGLIDANDKYYNQGLIDANDKYYNQGFKDGMKAQTEVILEELNELQHNTWDQDRIRKIKERLK